jgi:DNA polymerase/3'-5' exonuclease PolX
MGFFDDEKLKSLMKNIDFSEATGFSKKDQISVLGTTELTDKEYERIAIAVSEQTSQYKAMSKNRGSEIDGFYIVLVFKNHNEKDALCNNFGITLDEGRFIEGNTFVQIISEHAAMEVE